MKQRQAAGFTLVEIMIVVSIIGILSGLAMPGFIKSRARARLAALQSDLRVFEDAFQMYALENGGYPPDNDPGVFPVSMDGYMREKTWLAGPPGGGQYEWHFCSGFSEFMIAIHNGPDNPLMAELDISIDDGNPTEGRLISYGDEYYLRFPQ